MNRDHGIKDPVPGVEITHCTGAFDRGPRGLADGWIARPIAVLPVITGSWSWLPYPSSFLAGGTVQRRRRGKRYNRSRSVRLPPRYLVLPARSREHTDATLGWSRIRLLAANQTASAKTSSKPATRAL